MARAPSLFNPRFLVQNLRDGFDAAKARTGHEGVLIAVSGGGLLLAFFLLALLAPVAMRAPGVVSYGLGAVILIMVLASTGAGALALWRLMAEAGKEGGSGVIGGASILSEAAVQAALSDAEDAGLRALGARVVDDAITGRVQGLALAAVQSAGHVFLVIRLKQAVNFSLIFAPKALPWPHPLPPDGALTPVPPPGGTDGLAWATDREQGLIWSAKCAPAIAMSAAGGEAPFLSLRRKALVLRWSQGDVGTAALIGRELALVLAPSSTQSSGKS
ncbi:hypothetical protein PbB2_01904 [Candidatus Phycosocius bacilliformis]|uniref:Uncharacterized protein n=1 Tax=Candidatus Phycosocius bacilliformis TaxID=1445552 RepID=A0A2P2EB03_9PROT|nr:hypothetical protein [Candidatus Phycosocius bacilliformis]GBF58232.1 hypothetical protein PbB2_01904 [Candidatus Phycosocius bacilliformis]